MKALDGKVTLVTGGARGLGEAICRELSAAGATVLLADIRLGLRGRALRTRVRTLRPGRNATRTPDAGSVDPLRCIHIAAHGSRCRSTFATQDKHKKKKRVGRRQDLRPPFVA